MLRPAGGVPGAGAAGLRSGRFLALPPLTLRAGRVS